jgi:hypothetical protein
MVGCVDKKSLLVGVYQKEMNSCGKETGVATSAARLGC